MEDGPSCVRIMKRPLSGRGLGHVTNIKILGPPNTFERIELAATNLVQTCKTALSCAWTTKWPLNGRGQGHVTQCLNFVTLITFERIELSASIWYMHRAPSRPTCGLYKTTPKWVWPVHVTNIEIFGTPLQLLNNLTYLLQIWYRDGGLIFAAYEPQNDP